MKLCGVYAIVAPSGKRYIGSSVDIRQRWRMHRHLLRKGIHHSRALQRAWKKYNGDLVFRIVMLTTPGSVLLVEQEALDYEKPEYNSAIYVESGMKGRNHSAESKSRIGAFHRGRIDSPETRALRSAALMGHEVSEQARKKMSDAHANRSPEASKQRGLNVARGKAADTIICVETGERFPSYMDVFYRFEETDAKVTRHQGSHLDYACQNGSLFNGYHWRKEPKVCS